MISKVWDKQTGGTSCLYVATTLILGLGPSSKSRQYTALDGNLDSTIETPIVILTLLIARETGGQNQTNQRYWKTDGPTDRKIITYLPPHYVECIKNDHRFSFTEFAHRVSGPTKIKRALPQQMLPWLAISSGHGGLFIGAWTIWIPAQVVKRHQSRLGETLTNHRQT